MRRRLQRIQNNLNRMGIASSRTRSVGVGRNNRGTAGSGS